MPNKKSLMQRTFCRTIGTAFDPEWLNASVEGRMGDVIGVDLKELAARQLLVREGLLSESSAKLPLNKLGALDIALITARMKDLSDFSLDSQQLDFFAGRIPDSNPALKLLTQHTNSPVNNPSIVSRKSADANNAQSTVEADFKESGILFFVPNITDEKNRPKIPELSDTEKLRAGQTLADKFAALLFYFEDRQQRAYDPA